MVGSNRREETIGGRRVLERKMKGGQILEGVVEKVVGSMRQQQTAFGKFYLKVRGKQAVRTW